MSTLLSVPIQMRPRESSMIAFTRSPDSPVRWLYSVSLPSNRRYAPRPCVPNHNAPRAIFQHGANAHVLETQGGREILEPAVAIAAQSRIGTDPEAAVTAAGDGPGQIAVQAFGGAERRELAVAQPEQAAAVRADPETAFEILVQ